MLGISTDNLILLMKRNPAMHQLRLAGSSLVRTTHERFDTSHTQTNSEFVPENSRKFGFDDTFTINGANFPAPFSGANLL